MRRAFWDGFNERLRDKDTTQLEAMLVELCDRLKRLTPRRTDLHAEIDEQVDAELTAQMIRHDCFDGTRFAGMVEFVLGRLTALGAVADEAEDAAWRDAFRQRCANNEPYSALLPQFFERAHARLDQIAAAIAQWAEAQAQAQAQAQPPATR